jgi:hypothetical protein
MIVKSRMVRCTRRLASLVVCWRTPLVSAASLPPLYFYTPFTTHTIYHDSTTIRRNITLNTYFLHLRTLFIPCHSTIRQLRSCQPVSTCFTVTQFDVDLPSQTLPKLGMMTLNSNLIVHHRAAKQTSKNRPLPLCRHVHPRTKVGTMLTRTKMCQIASWTDP